MRFLVFLIATIIGLVLIKYSKWFVDNGLQSSWANEHLPLGSYSGIKILGVVAIVFGVLYLFGMI